MKLSLFLYSDSISYLQDGFGKVWKLWSICLQEQTKYSNPTVVHTHIQPCYFTLKHVCDCKCDWYKTLLYVYWKEHWWWCTSAIQHSGGQGRRITSLRPASANTSRPCLKTQKQKQNGGKLEAWGVGKEKRHWGREKEKLHSYNR
jgi:hypothetical protein